MTHPIPAPRPYSDPLYRPLPPLPRRSPLIGPSCPACEHPSCRQRRAALLPRRGGQCSEFAREHAHAAALQWHNPHLLVWFGEQTLSYWIASPTGLTEARDVSGLLTLMDPASALF